MEIYLRLRGFGDKVEKFTGASTGVARKKDYNSLSGNQLSKDVKSYIKDVEKFSNLKTTKEQRRFLKNALKEKRYERLSKEDTALNRKDFNNKMRGSKLIKEWEEKTNQKWTTYTDSKGKVKNYDAHHIIENKYGGPNEWWNLQPMRGGSNKEGLNQHQSGIHRAKSSKKLFPLL